MRRITSAFSKVVLLLAIVSCIGIGFAAIVWHVRIDEVDINSGRIRITHSLLGLNFHQSVFDSAVTKVLAIDKLGAESPEWRRVNRFAGWVRVSPHYAFHAAIHQISTLAMFWDDQNVPQPVRRQTANHLLTLWQYSNDYFLADDYLHGLWQLSSGDREAAFQRILDLRMPEDTPARENHIIRSVFYPTGQYLQRVEGLCDSDGRFVPDGVWETWDLRGRLQLHGQYRHGQLNGTRFQWDIEGRLTAIERFTRDQLTEYQSTDLEKHPLFAKAQAIARQGGTLCVPAHESVPETATKPTTREATNR